jgi:Rps23 Pro-64 3,4-dihydroxylase Tpa1-like proline 4-hydroxylase
MKLICQDNNHAVLDEVFNQEVFSSFWNYFNTLDFVDRSVNGWVNVWRLTDGRILAGRPFYHSEYPSNSPMDYVTFTIHSLATQYFKDIVGKEGEDWNEILLTPYLYATGTKISWHDDSSYTGACIFYPHKDWNPNWGGELLIAKTDEENFQGVDQILHENVKPILNKYGMGNYVSPLPNRMVFTKGKVWHSINRVDQCAGDHVRCSVVAFFMKNKISEMQV